MRRAALVIVGLTLLLGACSSGRDPRLNRPHPVFSPNGELLSNGDRHGPRCPEVLGGWWDRVAMAHGGRIDRVTFMADAEAQFAAMDLDHDGFITPSELSQVRAGLDTTPLEKIAPPGPDGRPQDSLPPEGGPYPGGGRQGGRRGGGGSGGAGIAPPRAAGSGQIPADVVDPVMSADKSLSFKVSHADYMAQAADIFAELDKAHQGLVTREAVLTACPPPP